MRAALLSLLLAIPAAAAKRPQAGKEIAAKGPAAVRAEAQLPRVLVARYAGVISPVSAEYLSEAVSKAGREKFDALVIELDTPGGLDLSMREIVKAILSSEVPVIVYVSPAGARAASAGVFITMAAHVAAMTPGTNIGAAHPIQIGPGAMPGGKEKPAKDDVMDTKITSDLSAYLQAIAARRGRSIEWATLVVQKSTSVPSALAVSANVVDLEAESLLKLLEAVDGRKVADFPKSPLRTKAAVLSRFEMSPRQRLLAAVSDPNIAMILMTLGVSGILIELYSPGLILPGIVGAVSLIMAFYSFQTLSASYAGILLILLGFLLYILELKIVSFGLLALAGTACVFFGAMMLFRDVPGVRVSWTALGSSLGIIIAVFAALAFVTKQALLRKSTTGAEGLEGAKGVVVSPLGPSGTVQIAGELWNAVSLEGPLPAGTEVVVVSSEALTVKVRRKA